MRLSLLVLPLSLLAACASDPTLPDPATPGPGPATPSPEVPGPSSPGGPGEPSVPPSPRGGSASISLAATSAKVTLTRMSLDGPASEHTVDVTSSRVRQLTVAQAAGETLAITVQDAAGKVERTGIMELGLLRWNAAPRTLSVPRDHATIQAAIDAASEGDTVLVAPGRYTEHLRMKSGVRLAGEDALTTILDAGPTPCQQARCPALIDFSEAHDVVIQSLTLRGSRTPLDGCVDPGDPFRCSGDWYTPAIYADGHLSGPWSFLEPDTATSALITGNIIEDNDVGLMLYFHAHAVVRSNIFRRNGSALVANHFQDHSLVANNVFWENRRMAVGNQAAYLDIVSNIFGRTTYGANIAFEAVQRGRIRCNIFFAPGPLTATDDDYVGDPSFIDAEHGNFGLRADSPAIAAGCLNGEDIGAGGGPMGEEAPL